jgi:kynureninase
VTTDPLLRFRDEFPTLAASTYLVSNSLGAMPRAARAGLAAYADAWEGRGVRAWADAWWELPVRVGDAVAPLMGAPPGSVAMTPTVTLAHAAVVSALPYDGGRDTIVMTALDFPSVRYAVEAMAARLGARVVVVGSEDGVAVDADAVCAAVDERTRLVAVSHVLFRSAFVMDAERIVRHAHAQGALVMLDAYHSVGVLPVDVQALGADFVAGGVLKWLCGGPGGSFLYVAPDLEARAGAPVRPGAHRLAGARAPVRLRHGHGVRGGRVGLARRHARGARALRQRGRPAPPRRGRAWTRCAPRACGRPSG